MMVASAIASVVALAVFSVLTSSMKLSTENAVTNGSSRRARQALDRIGQIFRYAQETPVLINADGTTATGTTSDGILIKNALGGPYTFFNANGQETADIPSGASSFMVEYAPSAGLDAPKVGDYFLVGLSTKPELEVASVGTPTGSPVAKVMITTKQSITETAKPGTYNVTACRYRKEAFIFAAAGAHWNLRHYPAVTSSTNYNLTSSYSTIGTGFQPLGTQAWFTATTDSGTQCYWLRALARSSNHAEYAESISGHNTLTTMPVQIKLWNYNAPPPPAS
jgi:hypothetical protein